MNSLSLSEISEYIKSEIGPQFHDKKIDKINKITLNDIIKRKNPYLFRAKANNDAHEFIKSVLDATVSSGEETTFGNFLENIAIFVNEQVYGGRKSASTGLDLEFEDGNKKYLISIKSGPNWGNAGQITNLKKNFNTAKRILTTSGGSRNINIICIEACCYGVDNAPDKGTHLKLCGQRFWELISGGDENLFRDIITPLGHLGKERNDELDLISSKKLNILTGAFIEKFCISGVIDWDSLIRFNSGKNPFTPKA